MSLFIPVGMGTTEVLVVITFLFRRSQATVCNEREVGNVECKEIKGF